MAARARSQPAVVATRSIPHRTLIAATAILSATSNLYLPASRLTKLFPTLLCQCQEVGLPNELFFERDGLKGGRFRPLYNFLVTLYFLHQASACVRTVAR